MSTSYPRRDMITGALAFVGVAVFVLYDMARGQSDSASIEASGDQVRSVAGSEIDTSSRTTGAPETTAPTTSSTTTEAETTTSTVESTAATGPMLPIEVICRDAWGASPAGDGMVEHTIDRLTVHHTAVAVDRVADGPGSILSHQQFHQGQKAWPDIAYHFLIDPGGNIYEGRDPAFRGDTATEYDPAGHFLVCIDGNFDEAAINEAQRAAATKMLAWGVHRYGVDLTTLAGHRDFAQTSCPGETVYALLADGSLLADVEALLASGVPELQFTCGPEGEATVAEIEASEA